ncbi:hypothetical protein EYF80_024409 [Liparis tanakae]|uniref:Uncharacterized protein n=1 Tax=Liparis tanakae TaxID=230148 RepID=A0A4Z2HKA9_9TELE|nr:hypothetical protein EYF80_024409 [Liparis tanakae]
MLNIVICEDLVNVYDNTVLLPSLAHLSENLNCFTHTAPCFTPRLGLYGVLIKCFEKLVCQHPRYEHRDSEV